MKWSGKSIFLFVFFICFGFLLVLFVVGFFCFFVFFIFLEIYFGFFNRCLTDCL